MPEKAIHARFQSIMPGRILFLCTGNYYRSRYAELLFNRRSTGAGLDWVAQSRGLAVELGVWNVGPISAHTRAACQKESIPLAEPVRAPLAVTEVDLIGASRVIALKEAEHRTYLSRRFPGWEDRVEYWHVDDLDGCGPEQALAEIARLVDGLVVGLQVGVEHR